MIPHKVVLKNFLTYADAEFDFTGEALWVVGGPNGAGKSALFDAVTFALFGVHCGGQKQRLAELVRHGADGFSVTLEFEFNGADYRVTRGYSRGSQTLPKLECRPPDGGWAADQRVTRVADLTPVVEELLGQSYDTFTKSVLLKQGEADKLISASGPERLEILKKVIGFEQYEALSVRVHDAAAKAKGVHDQYRRDFERLSPVDAQEIAEADDRCRMAADRLRAAREAAVEAARRVERAAAWERLAANHRDLERRLAEADARLRDAEAITASKRRFDELEEVVPIAESLVRVRTDAYATGQAVEHARRKLADATKEREAAAATAAVRRSAAARHMDAAAERRVGEIGPTLRDRKRWLGLSRELDTLAAVLSRYPADLNLQADRAATEQMSAEAELKSAEAAVTGAKTRLTMAREEQQKFAAVKDGAECPLCRQPVTREHAAKFRRQGAEKVARLRDELERSETAGADANSAADEARRRRTELAERASARGRAAERWEEKHSALVLEGATLDAAQHAREIEALEGESAELAGWASREHAARAAAEGDAAAAEGAAAAAAFQVVNAEGDLRAAGQKAAKLSERANTLLERFSDGWHEFAVGITSQSLAPFAAELASLRSSGVAARYERLNKDAAESAAWNSQFASVAAELAAVAPEDRVPKAEAEAARQACGAEADAAEADAAEAASELDARQKRAALYTQTAERLKAAERRAGLLKRLDDHLGERGLQRELVRDAEQRVIESASETLRRLSNQELWLEADADGRADRAFDLRVRRGGDSNPVRVDFVSGSQKFRVAVSLALAVGRFAAGQHRPIEAVIIDEGFGSLDEDGLRAMAESLRELRQAESLKRILLVSHQRNFTELFDSRYELTPGSGGTVAARRV